MSLPELFFSSIHSPLLAPCDPIHATSLKITLCESDDEDEKEKEHEGVTDKGEDGDEEVDAVTVPASSELEEAKAGDTAEDTGGDGGKDELSAPESETVFSSPSPIADDAMLFSVDDGALSTLVAFSSPSLDELLLITMSLCPFCPPPPETTSFHVATAALSASFNKPFAVAGKKLYHKNATVKDPSRTAVPHKNFW